MRWSGAYSMLAVSSTGPKIGCPRPNRLMAGCEQNTHKLLLSFLESGMARDMFVERRAPGMFASRRLPDRAHPIFAWRRWPSDRARPHQRSCLSRFEWSRGGTGLDRPPPPPPAEEVPEFSFGVTSRICPREQF